MLYRPPRNQGVVLECRVGRCLLEFAPLNHQTFGQDNDLDACHDYLAYYAALSLSGLYRSH